MNFKTTITFLFCILFSQTFLAAAGHDQLGIQTHFGHKDWNEPLSQLSQVKELGVGWIRDDILWRDVEAQRGQLVIPDFVWAWLKEAKKNDLKVIAVLNGSNTRGYEHPFNEDGYANFARFCARELKGYVHAFELVNEPFGEYRHTVSDYLGHQVSDAFGWDRKGNQLQQWPPLFLAMTNKAADAIESEAPGQYKVIGLGCAPTVNAHMIKLGVSPNVHGQVMHPYSHRWTPELQAYADTPQYLQRDGIIVGDDIGRFSSMMQNMASIAKANNGPAEIWLTEQGYTTYKRVTKTPRFAAFTEHAQAVYAQRRLMENLGLGIRFSSWYTMRDRIYHRSKKAVDQAYKTTESNFGITHLDGSPKLAYHAIQRLAQVTNGWKADAWTTVKRFHVQDRDYEHGYHWDGADRPDPGFPESRAYTFSKDGKRAIAIWSTEPVNAEFAPRVADTTFVSDRVLTQITAMDMMTGETSPIAFEQAGQQVSIPLLTYPDHPVFLTLTGDQPAVALNTHKEYFVEDQNWKVNPSKGVKAQFTITEEDKQPVGVLTYEMPEKNHGFTLVESEMDVPEETPVLHFQINPQDNTRVIVRAIDSTGQTFQFRFGASGNKKWRDCKIDLNGKTQGSWGGAADKTVHYPVKKMAIGVEKVSNGPLNGTINFRNLQFNAK
ncbi:MAG: hypothetical protein ACF8OB_15810 [Phycisphaeraceae bacterium JB051]